LREITFETHEFCSLCPVTNQPDLYTLKITYVPEQKCVESKSLKLYLTQWRNQGIFGEAVATTICNELYEALEPLKVEVIATQQIRGGLQMTTTAVRYQ
jgi:7-cyano-7-deazaguanine reductase